MLKYTFSLSDDGSTLNITHKFEAGTTSFMAALKSDLRTSLAAFKKENPDAVPTVASFEKKDDPAFELERALIQSHYPSITTFSGRNVKAMVLQVMKQTNAGMTFATTSYSEPKTLLFPQEDAEGEVTAEPLAK